MLRLFANVCISFSEVPHMTLGLRSVVYKVDMHLTYWMATATTADVTTSLSP